MSVTNITESSQKNEIWVAKKDIKTLFSADQVLNAWYKGKKDAIVELEQQQVETIENSFNSSGEATRKVFQFLDSIGIKPLSAHLNPKGMSKHTIIITVSEDDYFSDNMLQAYGLVRSIEKDLNPELDLMFMFMDDDGNIDLNKLVNDGFNFGFKG